MRDHPVTITPGTARLLADLPRHRFTYDPIRFTWSCEPAGLIPYCRPAGYCNGCGVQVTDEEIDRFLHGPTHLGGDLYLNLVVLLRDGPQPKGDTR